MSKIEEEITEKHIEQEEILDYDIEKFHSRQMEENLLKLKIAVIQLNSVSDALADMGFNLHSFKVLETAKELVEQHEELNDKYNPIASVVIPNDYEQLLHDIKMSDLEDDIEDADKDIFISAPDIL